MVIADGLLDRDARGSEVHTARRADNEFTAETPAAAASSLRSLPSTLSRVHASAHPSARRALHRDWMVTLRKIPVKSETYSSKAASPIGGANSFGALAGAEARCPSLPEAAPAETAPDSLARPCLPAQGTPLSPQRRARKPSLDSYHCVPGRLCQPHLLSIFIAFLAVVGMGGGGAAALVTRIALATPIVGAFPSQPVPPQSPPRAPPKPSDPPSPPSPPSSPPSPPSDPLTCYGVASSRTRLVLCTPNINNRFPSSGRTVEWFPSMEACTAASMG